MAGRKTNLTRQRCCRLGTRYGRFKQFSAAERCWKAYLKKSPDFLGHTSLAEICKAQGNLDLWKKTLDEYLKEDVQDLDHARIKVNIARYLMQKNDFKSARPYADAAAQTYAAWAMICASQCYEGLEDWEKSQIWIARTAVRYQNQSLQWIFWCARTGKGSFDEAKEVAEEYVKAMGKQFTGTDLLEMAFFYTITQQHRKSLDVYERMYKENRIESRALFLGIAADDCDNKERRDQVWKDWPKKGTPWADLGALFRESLAKGEKEGLDFKAVDKIIARLPADVQHDVHYYVGCFLRHHGKEEDARRYLNHAAISKEIDAYLRMLATSRLSELGFFPQPVEKSPK